MRGKLILGIVIIFVLFIFKSCFFSNCEKVNLTSEDRTWLSPYRLNDTVIFKSNKLNIDTFLVFVYNYSSFSKCNKLERSNNIYEEAGFSLKNINNDEFRVFMSLYKLYQEKTDTICLKDIRVNDLKVSFSLHDKKEDVELNNNLIDTYYFVGDTLNKYKKIYSFNWSKTKGLIRYKNNNGEVFSFHKIIRHKKGG